MEPEQLIARVQELTGRLEDLDDPACRSLAEELTSAVVQMYGAGLERIVELADAGTRDEMAKDSLVAGLLMIHDLYPVPIEERVTQALDTVRPYMESHGGNVELLGIEDGIAKLRLEGSCKSCRASSSTLELAVRQALEEAAPDLLGMDVEGVQDEEVTRELHCRMANGAPCMAHPRYRRPRRPARNRHVTMSPCSLPTLTGRCSPTGTSALTVAAHMTAVLWTAVRSSVRGAGVATSSRRRAGRWTTTTSSFSRSRFCARPRGSRVAL